MKLKGARMRGSFQGKITEILRNNKGLLVKELIRMFPDKDDHYIRSTYYLGLKQIREEKPLDPKEELKRIIKNEKASFSVKVNAIREYNKMIREENIQVGGNNEEHDDGFIKFLEILEKEDPGRHERQAIEEAKKKEERKVYIMERLKTHPNDYDDEYLISIGIEPAVKNLSLTPPESFHEK